MARISFVIAAFVMVLALMAAAPGTAGATMIDLQFGEDGLWVSTAPPCGSKVLWRDISLSTASRSMVLHTGDR